MTSHINLLSGLARVNGVYGPALDQLSGSPVQDGFGRVLIERPSANQLPNPTFAGLHYGTLSTIGGGVLPTNFARTNTIPMDVLPAPSGRFRHRVYRYTGSPTTAAPQISATGAAPGITPTDISRGGIAASGRLGLLDYTSNIAWVQVTLAAYSAGVLQRRADWKFLPGSRSKKFAVFVQVLAGETVHLFWAPTVNSASPTATTDTFSATIEVESLQLESATDGSDTTSFTTGTRASAQTCTLPVAAAASVLLETTAGGQWVDTSTDLTFSATRSYGIEQIHIRPALDLAGKNATVDTLHPPIWDYSAHDLDLIPFEGTSVQIQRPDVQPAEQHSFAVALNRQSMSRMEIRPGWAWATDAPEGNLNQRCEARHFETMPTTGDVWVSMALFLEFSSAATNFKILCQMFTNGDTDPGTGASEWHGPTVTMQLLAGDTLTMFTRGDSRSISTSSVPQHAAWSIAHFPRGVWHQFVHRLTFSTTGGGYLKSWHNGQLLFDASTPLGFNNAQGCYFKHGLYCGPSNDTIAVRNANVEVGTTDLSDRVANPLPIV